ncbi:polysaccharide deacetylase family protein [Lewinella sp. 4G2]|uniref:polysaccharide deacetylase family protein n=1 Tax=Lewinella sp. 4G2 TaxID=1803372 RepID=UPI0007B4C3C9|nr:polysaccharide deacetylase family protein [Lewinella sp. 4G2]OAV44300.1 hypothetical protein A3850_007245 [Lewinella sp. 4G2]
MAKGILFHHFHDAADKQAVVLPGSIEKKDFKRIIERVKEKYYLNDADEWIEKARHGGLTNKDVCLTFDDGIRSQYSIAKEVMDEYGVKAFFFIYSGMYVGETPRLEIYRLFRSKFFSSFDDFLEHFLAKMKQEQDVEKILEQFPEEYLSQFSFYSRNERRFRYIRDLILSRSAYNRIMDALIAEFTTIEKLSESVWIMKDQLVELSNDGHTIGLHSVSHPTKMEILDDSTQYEEYFNNKNHLEAITGKEVVSIAYPSGSYNKYTLKLMNELGIQVGFRADERAGDQFLLETPRIDGIDALSRL